MRLVAFFQHFPPYPGAGALRAESLLDALAARPEIDLSAAVGCGKDAPSKPYEVVSLLGEPLENKHSVLRRMLGELILGAKAIASLERAKADLFLISSPSYLAALMSALWAVTLRRPYILDIRDIYPQVYVSAGLIKPQSFPDRILTRMSGLIYRRALKIIAATQGLADRIQEACGRDDIEVIYNGFPANLRTFKQEKYQRFTACFHGVMGFYQDIETLMAVARALEAHDVDVVVIGYGRKEEILRANPPSNLRFLGRHAFSDTIAEVARCHVGLCFRTDDEISRDAFPVKVFEYLALNAPVILTPPCEGGEFVERKRCGVQLPSGDVDGLVREILRLRDDEEYRQRMIAACAKVGNEMSREAQAERFAEIVLAAAEALQVPAAART